MTSRGDLSATLGPHVLSLVRHLAAPYLFLTHAQTLVLSPLSLFWDLTNTLPCCPGWICTVTCARLPADGLRAGDWIVRAPTKPQFNRLVDSLERSGMQEVEPDWRKLLSGSSFSGLCPCHFHMLPCVKGATLAFTPPQALFCHDSGTKEPATHGLITLKSRPWKNLSELFPSGIYCS